jgi:Cu2+-exporting ATPase/Cu+-exporting ATPase
LYLEGIHCLGCLWILEKLTDLDPGILQSRLQMSSQILAVSIDPLQTSWEAVTKLLGQLGYAAHPIRGDSQKADNRGQLLRIGTAAFCAGNLMTLSASLYAGSAGPFSRFFSWLSVLLFLPVLFYCAAPLYRSALGSLRAYRVSIDLPIAVALWAGAFLSLWEIALDRSTLYFDSLSMLVFLLLSSRYLLQRFRQSLSAGPLFLSFLSDAKYQRRFPSPGAVEAQELKSGDCFLLLEGETLPVDAVLQSPEAYFDLSLATGESLPVKFHKGDTLEAGAKGIGQAEFVALRPAGASRLASILKQLQEYRLGKSPALSFADRIGQVFTLVVLAAAAAVFLWFLPSDPWEGARRSLALAVVTCPCVLAFAIPLAFTRALQQAAGKGILFQNPEKLEALAGAKHLFLDKTGTLTSGQYQVLRWQNLSGALQRNLGAAAALESGCPHPVAKAVSRYAGSRLQGKAPEVSATIALSDG